MLQSVSLTTRNTLAINTSKASLQKKIYVPKNQKQSQSMQSKVPVPWRGMPPDLDSPTIMCFTCFLKLHQYIHPR